VTEGGGIEYKIFILSCNEKIRVIYEYNYNELQNYDIKMKKHMCIYIYIYICICVFMYMYVYMYTHIHTHTGGPPYPRIIRLKTYRGYAKPRIIPNALYNEI